MDSYLSGRENLGDKPKPKEEPSLLPPQALQKLQAPSSELEENLHEEEGQSGSKVQYLTEEGRVTKIIVTCPCGQVTEIDCQYRED